jgi:hypothetical protein
MSSFVLDSYQQLLKDHLVVTLFLTMLVGAGGNAGNQSAIKVIRGLVSHPAYSLQFPCCLKNFPPLACCCEFPHDLPFGGLPSRGGQLGDKSKP